MAPRPGRIPIVVEMARLRIMRRVRARGILHGEGMGWEGMGWGRREKKKKGDDDEMCDVGNDEMG